MRAKLINEESGGYPPGAENDPRAPWNEKEDNGIISLEIKDYDYKLVTRTPIGKGDDEEIVDESTIDPYDMDKLICQKLGLDFQELDESGEGIEIINVDRDGDKFYLTTSKGDLEVSLSELIQISE